MRQLFLFAALLGWATLADAQTLLNKTVSVHANHQPLASVLENIGRQGNFHFSYVREFIHDDSLVTIRATNKTVKQVLDQLFQGTCQYKEISDQLILQRAPREKWFVVSGHVTDATSGSPISNASVYERMQLISTLTNEQGYFRLRLKEQPTVTSITISKDLYKDTIMYINSGFDQDISATIKSAAPIQLTVVDVNQHSHVEQTWLGKFFLSSRQRVQSLNISDFFTNQPYQTSIIPGAGTHGKLGSQVINKGSFNIIGGYTAGLNGVEFAGIFNIDQKDVRYVQVAGVFNVVGGTVRGVETAGLYNQGMDSLSGLQVGGIANMLKKGFTGVQLAGISNKTGGRGTGMQIAGITNRQTGPFKGLQVAGIANRSADTVGGLQVAGIINYAHQLQGVQIGLVNMADSSNGYSIGLLNIVRHGGYNRLLIYNNELMHVNLAYKSGNRKLYTLITAGMRLDHKGQIYSLGGGLGHAFRLNTQMDLNTEYIYEILHIGHWTDNQLNRLQLTCQYRVNKYLSIYGGPSAVIFYKSENYDPPAGFTLPHALFSMGNSATGWLGWQIGISIFR